MERYLELNRDLAIVQEKLHDVRTKWYNIGVQLQIPVATLDSIRYENPRESGDCLRDMLKEWLKNVDSPTWRGVVKALRSTPVSEHKLAGDLQVQYCTHIIDQPTPTSPKESEAHSPSSETLGIPEEALTTRNSPEQESDHRSGISLDDDNFTPQPNFICGCGHCSLSSWLEEGCPNASEQNIKYPFLDLGGLSLKERRAFEAKLDGECIKITFKFSKLVTKTEYSLIERQVSVEQLASCLSDLGTYEAVYPNEPVLFHHLNDIHKAKSIHAVFCILINYRSFFNYHIIEHIIEILGTTDDRENLSTYKEDLKVFLKRRVFECPECVCKPLDGDYKTDLVVKIGKTKFEKDFYMIQASVYQATVSEILGLKIAVLLLCHISKGCVQLTFQIPKFVVADGKIFPLNDRQTDALQAKRIIKLTCGGFSWECEPEITPEEVPIQQVLSLANATSTGENLENSTVSMLVTNTEGKMVGTTQAAFASSVHVPVAQTSSVGIGSVATVPRGFTPGQTHSPSKSPMSGLLGKLRGKSKAEKKKMTASDISGPVTGSMVKSNSDHGVSAPQTGVVVGGVGGGLGDVSNLDRGVRPPSSPSPQHELAGDRYKFPGEMGYGIRIGKPRGPRPEPPSWNLVPNSVV